MVMLHYFVSTSFFIVNVAEYDWYLNGTLHNNSIWDYTAIPGGAIVDPSGWVLNYSPIAIVCTLIASLLLTAFPIALGYRKLDPSIPVVGSSIALISAACHPPQDEENVGLLPVQWGLLEGSVDPQTRLGYCTISSGEVSLPDEGQEYRLVGT
ncbi:hypothetical protein N431DRAFT_450405 [Stipitochalara longipes BDJ]|nr:hypothetical protein N431DRAFT_450405 [Stipitochalara longipes BDJ]